MINIEVSEYELSHIVSALNSRKRKRVNRLKCWEKRIDGDSLLVPLEVAESFVVLGKNSVHVIDELHSKLKALVLQ